MNLSKFSLGDWANLATIVASTIAIIGFISGIVALIYRFVHRRRKKDDDRDKGNSGGGAPAIAIVFVPVVFVLAGASATAAVVLVGSGQVQGVSKDIVAICAQAAPYVVVVFVAALIVAFVVTSVESRLPRRTQPNLRRPLTGPHLQAPQRPPPLLRLSQAKSIPKPFPKPFPTAKAPAEIYAAHHERAAAQAKAEMDAALRQADQAGKQLREAQRNLLP